MTDLAPIRKLHHLDRAGRVRTTLMYRGEPSMKAVLARTLTGHEYVIPGFVGDYLRGLAAPVFVDVGANVGAAAIFFRNCFPRATIYCFEPVPSTYELLQENIRRFSKIRAIPIGLYSRDCVMPIFNGRLGSASDSVVCNDLTTDEGVPVRMARASAEFARLGLDRLHLLKIDTEGCEVPIVQDLGERLTNTDIAYIEYHSETDRVTIDRILSPMFSLFHARVDFVHRGVFGYIAKRLAVELREMNEYEIGPAADI